MKKLFAVIVVLGLMAISTSAMAGDKAKATTVTGWVSDQHCGAKHNSASAEAEACVKKCADGKSFALVTDGDSKVWNVENADAVKGHENHHVKVTGTPNAEKGTIHIDKVEMVKEAAASATKKK